MLSINKLLEHLLNLILHCHALNAILFIQGFQLAVNARKAFIFFLLKHCRELCYRLNVGLVSKFKGVHFSIEPDCLNVLALRVVVQLFEDITSVLKVSLPFFEVVREDGCELNASVSWLYVFLKAVWLA